MASWKGYLTPFLPGSVNLVRRGSRRTVRKKYRSERKGRRSFDTRIQYDMANLMAIEKTRTRRPTGGPRYPLGASRPPAV